MYRDFTVNLQQHRIMVHAVLFHSRLCNFINVCERKFRPRVYVNMRATAKREILLTEI